MSEAYKDRDLLDIAKEAERDLNSPQAATGTGTKASEDSSVAKDPDGDVGTHLTSSTASKFPGSTLETGASASGTDRVIPASEGGDTIISTGKTSAPGPGDGDNSRRRGQAGQERLTTGKDFEGEGFEGPEGQVAQKERDRGGDDDVRGNIR